MFCIFWAARHFRSFGGGTEVGADLNNPATKNINVSCGLISNKLGERKISKSLNKLCSGRILSKYICWLYVRIRNLPCPLFVQRASHILYWESEELATLRCDAKKQQKKYISEQWCVLIWQVVLIIINADQLLVIVYQLKNIIPCLYRYQFRPTFFWQGPSQ